MRETVRLYARAHTSDPVAYLLDLFGYGAKGPYLDSVASDGLAVVAQEEWEAMVTNGEWAETPEAAEATSRVFGQQVMEVTPVHVLTALAEWLEIEG